MSDGTKHLVDLVGQAAESFGQRPSWDEYFMATAKLMASRSNCERLHVGCVIVTAGDRKNRLVAAGWTVLRFTWWDLTQRPDYVVASICAMMIRRAG